MSDWSAWIGEAANAFLDRLDRIADALDRIAPPPPPDEDAADES